VNAEPSGSAYVATRHVAPAVPDTVLAPQPESPAGPASDTGPPSFLPDSDRSMTATFYGSSSVREGADLESCRGVLEDKSCIVARRNRADP
jgi:hypothetical protein